MPAFDASNAPKFAQIITEGETINLTGTVSGAEKYHLEFLVVDEQEGRPAPKVLHMDQVEGSSFTVQVPKNYADPVWLIITADLTGDGPSEDDMIGGTTEALTFGADDLELQFTLKAEADFLQKLPWFTKDQAGPPPEGGTPPPGAAPSAGAAPPAEVPATP